MHKDPPILVELFAGSAALTRHVVGAPSRLVSWLGGKLRVADTLARTLDLSSRTELDSVILCDAGPWGWVWPVILDVETRVAVVAVLRRWSTTCPACEGAGRVQGGACRTCARSKAGPGGGPDASDLWAWLASQPPRVDPAERTAGWLWLQARSASGSPVWFDETRWAQGSAHGAAPQPMGERGVWLNGPRLGRDVEPAAEMGWAPALIAHPPVRMGDEGGSERSISQKGMTIADHDRANESESSANQCWLMSDGRGVPRPVSEKGRGTPTRARGIVHVSTLADRLDGFTSARWPAPSEALAEVVAAWVVLQSGSTRGRPVDIDGGMWQTDGYAHLTPSARDKGFTSRLHLPRISDRVARLEEGAWPSVACVHGSAMDALPMVLALGRRARVLLDPPYHRDGDTDRDRTGYGADLPLADTLQMAAQLNDAGALVTICEGGPLARDLGPGWFSYDYSAHFTGRVVGREWVTCNRPQPFLDGPRQQVLFPLG